MRLIQLTIGSSASQVTTGKIYSPFVTFQNNNASGNIRIGDNTVSATKGILITPGGSFTVQRADNRIPLFTYYGFGSSQVLDVLYE